MRSSVKVYQPLFQTFPAPYLLNETNYDRNKENHQSQAQSKYISHSFKLSLAPYLLNETNYDRNKENHQSQAIYTRGRGEKLYPSLSFCVLFQKISHSES
jgi:hypothetical protein